MKDIITAITEHEMSRRNHVLVEMNREITSILRHISKDNQRVLIMLLLPHLNLEEREAIVDNLQLQMMLNAAYIKATTPEVIKVINPPTEDEKWEALFEGLLFNETDNDDFQIDPNDAGLSAKELCNKYFPGETI